MISIENVFYNYSKKKPLFTNLEFNQESGNIIGLLGKNGAGKSTFLKLLAGLLFPKSGNIIINGYKPLERNPDFLADVFFVSDTPLYPALKIKQYVKALSPFYKNFDLEKLKSILKEFELDESYILTKISHGQQKKFMIAFALATNCKLLLFDEPTNGLDIPSKSIFRKVMVNSINENQTAIIATHQVKDIENIIDEVVVLDGGKILFKEAIFNITQKYAFKTVFNVTEEDGVLYSEKSPEGYSVIVPVKGVEEETVLNIELLFNALTKNIKLNI